VPAQLLGTWFLPPAALDALIGCPKPLRYQTCSLRLDLVPTSYSFQGAGGAGPGDVVVNNTEIDFFNAPGCGSGRYFVARYTWTLKPGVLHFTPLNADPCGRSAYLANQSYINTIPG